MPILKHFFFCHIFLQLYMSFLFLWLSNSFNHHFSLYDSFLRENLLLWEVQLNEECCILLRMFSLILILILTSFYISINVFLSCHIALVMSHCSCHVTAQLVRLCPIKSHHITLYQIFAYYSTSNYTVLWHITAYYSIILIDNQRYIFLLDNVQYVPVISHTSYSCCSTGFIHLFCLCYVL
jgi:hypothetical protein